MTTLSQSADLEFYFDEAFYALSEQAKKDGIRPIDHYLTVGEALHFPPSRHFDPKYYLEQNPDLKGWTGGLLSHYVMHGRAEGRRGFPITPSIECPTDKIDPALETVFIAIHEASRSGAPILAWNLIKELRKRYNVVALLKSGGPIEAVFNEAASAVVKIPADFPYGSGEDRLLARKLFDAYSPTYAIANSVATREIALLLERNGVPVIALIHEFSSYIQPIGVLNPFYISVSRLVFPARLVAEASLKDYPGLKPRQLHVLPQGPSKVPSFDRKGVEGRPLSSASSSLKTFASLSIGDESIIIGTGRIEYRKGVDVFIAAAAEVRRRTRRKFKFIWVGHLASSDQGYFEFLQEQIKRSGLENHVFIVDEVDDLAPVYRRANVFFLSSRLDPLPNVAIDAALRKIPIVSFENASGISEFLSSSQTTKDLVVPYVDSAQAGHVIANLIGDAKRSQRIGAKLQVAARAMFNMPRYAKALDRMGRECAAECVQMVCDRNTILKSGIFDASLRFGDRAREITDEEAVQEYLDASRLARPLHRPKSGMLIRRPMTGFHPLVYALEHPEVDRRHIDPLAHYLRKGRPEGRWTHRVLRPDVERATMHHSLRVAIHGHFFYPDLLERFVKLLAVNDTPVDLFLTTGGKDQAANMRKTLRVYGLKAADVWVVPNRGRDIGPFLTDMPAKLHRTYDLVGHIHGKRSKHVNAAVGDQWRDFAWQHLIGDLFPMVDVIADAFARDGNLGLVFPEDPHLNAWDENRELADDLARRMKLELPLPDQFDFPIGTMFWARPSALKPMFDLALTMADFPPEPVPIDGTILHALERLVPFSAKHAGYAYATTHVPGVTR